MNGELETTGQTIARKIERSGKKLVSASDWLNNVWTRDIIVDGFGQEWHVFGIMDNDSKLGGGRVFTLVYELEGQDIGSKNREVVRVKVTATSDDELFTSGLEGECEDLDFENVDLIKSKGK